MTVTSNRMQGIKKKLFSVLHIIKGHRNMCFLPESGIILRPYIYDVSMPMHKKNLNILLLAHAWSLGAFLQFADFL